MNVNMIRSNAASMTLPEVSPPIGHVVAVKTPIANLACSARCETKLRPHSSFTLQSSYLSSLGLVLTNPLLIDWDRYTSKNEKVVKISF